MRFEGRHVVVTGGTGGLGRAVVRRFVDEGANCHVPVFLAEELDGFTLSDHPRVQVTPGLDLTNDADVSAYYAALPGLWASIQLVGGFSMAPLRDTSALALREMLEINVMTCFLSCREAARAIARADGEGGRLVNITARPALTPSGGMVAYSTAKAAVASLTQCLGEELRDEGITVNALAPSIIDTPANRAAMPGAAVSRWVTPATLADTIAYLASPAAGAVTGMLVPAYGRA